MIQEQTDLDVADNTGARRVRCYRVYGQRKSTAGIGDVIRVSVKEAQPGGLVKKGSTSKAIIVRTKRTIRRADGTAVRFDSNAAVLVNDKMEPLGSRIFGPGHRALAGHPGCPGPSRP